VQDITVDKNYISLGWTDRRQATASHSCLPIRINLKEQ